VTVDKIQVQQTPRDQKAFGGIRRSSSGMIHNRGRSSSGTSNAGRCYKRMWQRVSGGADAGGFWWRSLRGGDGEQARRLHNTILIQRCRRVGGRPARTSPASTLSSKSIRNCTRDITSSPTALFLNSDFALRIPVRRETCITTMCLFWSVGRICTKLIDMQVPAYLWARWMWSLS